MIRSPKGRAWALVAAIGLAATTVWLVTGRIAPVHAPVRIPWIVFAVAFALGDMAPVHFEFRGQGYSLNIQETVLVVGLVFSSPLDLLAARIAATILAMGIIRRQPPVKLSFNVAQQALRVGIAVATFGPILGASSPLDAKGWLAMTAAAGSASVVGDIAILAVIWATSGRPSASTLAELAVAAPVLLVVTTTLGVVSVTILWTNVAGAWTLAVLIGVAVFVHRVHHRVRRGYKNLDRLYTFTAEIAKVRPYDELLTSMVARTRAVVSARRCSLLLLESSPVRVEVEHDNEPVVTTGAVPNEAERLVIASGRGFRYGRRDRRPDRRCLDPGFQKWASRLINVMSAPVEKDGVVTAVLTAENVVGPTREADRESLKMLEAIAHAAAGALARAELVEELRRQALHDDLTGLANRNQLAAYLSRALARRRSGEHLGVLLMDVDDFKDVNDTLGHGAGDQVLRAVADRLRTGLPQAFVARLGGDEFAVVGHGPPEEMARLAEEARRLIEQPVLLEGMSLQVRASVGIAVAPEHGEQGELLLRRADVAMYRTKEARAGHGFYALELDHHSTRRLALLGDLEVAIHAGQLRLLYQPKVHLSGGRVAGVEALLRWEHPVHGRVMPDEFIPAAEHTGLIDPLTRWVVREAWRQREEWLSMGLQLEVAVNVSAHNLRSASLADDVADLGRGPNGLAGLTFELTESSLLTDNGEAMEVLARLRGAGAHVSIDDFGTGYSSLARLSRLEVDEVKIDKSLVRNMMVDLRDAAVVRSAVDLASHLGLVSVAEGVEDAAMWHRLVQLGCTVAQGYFLARPLEAADVPGWIAQWSAPEPLAMLRPFGG
ncbi:MAG TPA: EAL domain-containing protein [Acidimicrobiales bacterium]|nr:EAL domain-containing protein [Acidimicrobiales bacterium]